MNAKRRQAIVLVTSAGLSGCCWRHRTCFFPRAGPEAVHARAGSISDAPPGPEAPPPPPPREAGKALRSLGTKQVSNIFVQLRKIAQHPLLIRSLYPDSTITTMATICRKRSASVATAAPLHA